jgi:glycosidase
MTLLKLLLHFALAAIGLLATLPAHAYEIEHLEPRSWWVGMKNPQLQLMVHGERIAELTPELRHPGVTLKRSSRTDNPNYLFLDLLIAPSAQPGELLLRFKHGGKVVLSQRYALQARRPGSAQRRGFDQRDAIYLIVPDRFANGDPGNDQLAALGDLLDRSNPSARHGGDLQGIADHLDYIAGMGFTQIWPTPLVENKQPEYSYHGYSATDLYKIDPRFGSNESYRALVAAAKAKGIGFIQDVAPNHIGSGHWWLRDLPSRDWLNPQQPYVETNHRHTTAFDRYAASSDRRRFNQGWFVPTMPDLNQRNPLLATYLVQNAVWWIEYADLSGLRVDTYPYSDKAFMSRWSKAILDEYPRLSLVGEEMSNNPVMVSYWLRGMRNADGYRSYMPSMMDFPLFDTLRQALVEPEGQGYGVGFGRLYDAMVNDMLYPEPGRLVLFDGNHDTSRIYSALGEDEGLLRMALVFIATTRRIPQFLYGTELLMSSPLQRDDGAVRADFPGGWPADSASGFSAAGLSPRQIATQSFMRKLLNWRKTASAVHDGRLVHFNPLGGSYVYFRQNARQTVMVAMNKNAQEIELETARFAEVMGRRARGVDLISGVSFDISKHIKIPARSALVLELLD